MLDIDIKELPKKRMLKIKRIYDFFKQRIKPEDVEIIFTNNIKFGVVDIKDELAVIKINKRLPFNEILLTIIHEFLHLIGLEHNKKTRKMGYWSWSSKRDILSEEYSKQIFGRKLRW